MVSPFRVVIPLETDIPMGGIVIGVSNSIIKNCEIINNTSNDGGGVFVEGGSFIDCIINNNTSNFTGGGIKMASEDFKNLAVYQLKVAFIVGNTWNWFRTFLKLKQITQLLFITWEVLV